jgi:hypothetical protein
MKTLTITLKLLSALALVMVCGTACESTDGGSAQVSGGGSFYYGVGFYDPWYYGGADYPPDVIVTPPGDRPMPPPHVEQPIALPPSASVAPRPTPMPSIPSTPRPSFHR